MNQYDPPDPPSEPTHVDCAGGCGSTIVVDDAYRLRIRGVEKSLCLRCALDALHKIDPLNSATIGSSDLVDAAIVYEDAARECRRLAKQDARPEVGASPTPPVAGRSSAASASEVAAARSAGRLEGLEEAAMACDSEAKRWQEFADGYGRDGGASGFSLASAVRSARAGRASAAGSTLCATRIRALAGQPPDPVREAAPELLEALRGVIDFTLGRPGENTADAFERIAEDFRRDTGHLRPGKSLPLEMCWDDQGGRERAWQEWIARKGGEMKERCYAAIAKVTPKKED